jgi:3-hydroxyisobutyrate dehydrogenase
MRVAVLGTGIMGAPMAKNVASAGHDVVVWNRTREKAEATGLAVGDSPQEAVRGADVVVTMLRDVEAVKEAVGVIDWDGAGWMQSSTVGLGIEELSAVGDTLVDAPVLGTRKPAEEGTLSVFLSGPQELRARVRPVAEAVGSKIVDVGDRIGDATRLKLVMNSWVLMLTEATAELLAFADAAGIEPRRVLDALKGGAMDSVYLQTKGAAIVEQSFAPSFKLETALKDVQLIRELAARSGVDLALIEATEQRFEQAIAAGHGEDDMSATWHASRRPPEGG